MSAPASPTVSDGSETPSAPRRLPGRMGLLLFLLMALCALSWLHQSHYDFENDDAYISYRYARHWATGQGPVFNPGERVEGYSNFLLVAVLAAVQRLGGNVVEWSRALGTLASWGLLVLVYQMLSTELRRPPAVALMGALVVALHASVATWARSGMETLPLAFLVLLAQFTFLRERRLGRAHWLSGSVWAAVALMRADGFVHLGATVLFALLSRRDRRRLGTLLLPFLAVFLPYFLWRWQYYGFFFPNPYYLRTGGDLYQQLRGLFYVHNEITAFGGLLAFAFPLVLLFLRHPERDAQRLYLGMAVCVFGVYVIWVGGDYMPMGRFFVPILAPLAILQIEAAVELSARLDPRRLRRAVFALLAMGLAFSAFLPTLNRRRQPQNRAILARTQVQQWTLAGRWFRNHVPEGSLLAAEPVGAVGFYSNLPIIDMLGVNDTHIAHRETASMGHSTAGHEKRDFAYVLSRHPRFLFRGVWPHCDGDGQNLEYPDGSVYRVRCVSLGRGPVADSFGTVRETELFLRLEERVSDETPQADVAPG